MGGSHHSTNVHETEIHNKDITATTNNVENENNHYKEHNEQHNTLNGDKAYGGGVATNGDSNYGNAVYKLVNLDTIDLQNLGGIDFGGIAKAVGAGAQAGGDIWKAVDPKSYNQQGKAIMGGVGAGAGVAGDLSKEFGFQNLDQQYQYELQNLGGFNIGGIAKAVGAGAQAGGDIWKAVDPKSYNQQGAAIMGGVGAGAGVAGDLSKEFGFQNLDQQYQYELQNLGFDIGGIAKAVGGGAKAGGDIWKAVDPKSYNQQGAGIMGGIAGGAGVAGDLSKEFGFQNLDQQYQYELQNLGFDIGGIAKAVGGGAKAGGDIWKAVDPKSYNQQGAGIMGGIAGGAGVAGDLSKEFGFQNLEASTAIVATPEQALELLSLNSQLDQPYEIKGAYLI